MLQITDYTDRVLDQEIDAIEVCPGHTDHVIVATYSLIKDEPTTTENNLDEVGGSSRDAPRRVGSLQVLPVDYDTSTLSGEASSLCRTRRDFPCAILDIRFHPTFTGLLGAATSIGEVRFFDIVWPSKEAGCDGGGVEIVPLGKVEVSVDTATSLITQFSWIEISQSSVSMAGHDVDRTVYLTTCDTTGQVRLIRVNIPSAPQRSEPNHGINDDRLFSCEIVDIHKHLHDLEAWTTTTIPLANDPGRSKHLVLSGGDDSSLIASTLTIDTASTESAYLLTDLPTRIHLDKRTHSAGVVSILPLQPTLENSIPILTGSYDQRLRLIMFDPATNAFTPTSELELEGGVWRIALLTTYAAGKNGKRDWVLLVCAMYAGCYIVRLSLAFVEGAPAWTWGVEMWFREPHESMVYAAAVVGDGERAGRWTVVSTSFYDKRVCVWRWTDAKMELEGP